MLNLTHDKDSVIRQLPAGKVATTAAMGEKLAWIAAHTICRSDCVIRLCWKTWKPRVRLVSGTWIPVFGNWNPDVYGTYCGHLAWNYPGTLLEHSESILGVITSAFGPFPTKTKSGNATPKQAD